MRTPKPPTARSVSATLTAHDLRAARDDRDGYLVEWFGMPGASPVRVSYRADDTDLRTLAMGKMTAVLQRKGWLVRDAGYLIVEEG